MKSNESSCRRKNYISSLWFCIIIVTWKTFWLNYSPYNLMWCFEMYLQIHSISIVNVYLKGISCLHCKKIWIYHLLVFKRMYFNDIIHTLWRVREIERERERENVRKLEHERDASCQLSKDWIENCKWQPWSIQSAKWS